MLGKLEVIVGPMFAGKTSELVKRILWVNHQGKTIRVCKPAMDNRYANTEIVTHTNFRYEATPVEHSTEISLQGVDTYFIDEVQFYDHNLIEVVQNLLLDGANIVAAGLDTDYRGRAFNNTAHLMAMADKITKIHSFCSVCGKPAGKTFKKTISDQLVELGENELYEARCNEHWFVVDK